MRIPGNAPHALVPSAQCERRFGASCKTFPHINTARLGCYPFGTMPESDDSRLPRHIRHVVSSGYRLPNERLDAGRAPLLQQPRRNSDCVCLHPTCPGVFAMSPPAKAKGNIHDSTGCE